MSDLLNLGDFKSPKVVNTRTSTAKKQQQFDLKYREGTFTISTAMFATLNLTTNAIGLMINGDNKALFLSVENSKGDILVRTPKTGVVKIKTFKSNVLEAALVATGLITKAEHVKGVEGVNQILALVATPTTDGETAYVIAAEGTVAAAPTGGTDVGTTDNTTDTAPAASNAPASEDLLGSGAVSTEDEDFEEKF